MTVESGLETLYASKSEMVVVYWDEDDYINYKLTKNWTLIDEFDEHDYKTTSGINVVNSNNKLRALTGIVKKIGEEVKSELKEGYEVKTHEAAQITLGHLLVPNQLEKEDLEILNQTHKVFEDEYVKYFEDAKIESSTARYNTRPSYTEKRVEEILQNAKKFINKIDIVINN